MPSAQQINNAWAENRSYLVNLAFRMLGDIGEAEDVVQEAFVRLSLSDFDTIEDERGWLIVVTSRLCLDLIRSARARREESTTGGDLEMRIGQPSTGAVDPADRVTLDDGVRLALLVVLERLSPAERVAFVLHDVFRLPFEAVAETVGRPAPTCRQLARRARQKIEAPDGPTHVGISTDQHREVTDRFIAACANGNFDDLLEVLDPDVSGGVDLRPGLVVHGAQRVATNILTYWGGHPSLVSLPVTGDPCLLAFVDRELAALLVLTVRDERVTKIHVHARPEAVDGLRRQLLVR